MLSFSDANGNFYNLLGRLGGVLKLLRTYQSSAKAVMVDLPDGVTGQTKLEADVQAIMGDNYLSILQASGANVGGTLQQIAAAYLDRLVYRDSPRPGQTLTSSNVSASLGELIRQMKAQGATVRRHVLGSSVGAFTGTGNGVLCVSATRPADGLPLEHLFAETLTAVCTQDSFLGGVTAGNETLTVVGAGSQGDVFAFDWPLGSDCVASLQAIDGASDVSAGNLLTNSGFDSFTANVPDDWDLMVGTAGTDVLEEASAVYGTGKALGVVSDGSTLVQIRQTFGSSSGTTAQLDSLSQYAFCIFLRGDGVPSSQGTLVVDLFDGTNVITDAAGASCSVSIDLTGLTTLYAGYVGVFRTPMVVPDTCYLRVRFSVPADAGRSVFLDKLSLGFMSQLYVGGPYVSCHAGSVPFVTGDYAAITMSNSRDGSGGLDTFQTVMARLFPQMISQELFLPSSSVPSISDGLIR